MKIRDHLDKSTKKKLNDIELKEKQRKETEELMGVYRERYERRGGAVRRYLTVMKNIHKHLQVYKKTTLFHLR